MHPFFLTQRKEGERLEANTWREPVMKVVVVVLALALALAQLDLEPLGGNLGL